MGFGVYGSELMSVMNLLRTTMLMMMMLMLMPMSMMLLMVMVTLDRILPM